MTDQPGVLDFASWVTRLAVTMTRLSGEEKAYGQYFDSEPENEEALPETEGDQLWSDDARDVIGERIKAGFDGFAAFTCPQEGDGELWLYVEAYDTRGQRSMSSRTPMKRTITGKFKQIGPHELLDFPSIPGIFTPASDGSEG